MEVEFDGPRRRFVANTRALVNVGPNAQEKSRLRQSQVGNNLDAAAAAGLGTLHDVRIRLAFDGNQLAEFTEAGGAYIRRHDTGSPYFCFDARILGIARTYGPGYTLDHCLGYTVAGSKASVAGRETVGGRSLWHVVVAHPAGVEYHFWVESDEGFRVHRYEYRAAKAAGDFVVTAVSEYQPVNGVLPVLPTKVTVDEVFEEVKKGREDVFEITQADYSYKPDPAVFTLKGIELPVGTRVDDDRISRAAGYWNGSELSPTAAEAKAVDTAAQMITESQKRRKFLLVLGAVIGGGVVISLILYRYGRRAAESPAAPQ